MATSVAIDQPISPSYLEQLAQWSNFGDPEKTDDISAHIINVISTKRHQQLLPKCSISEFHFILFWSCPVHARWPLTTTMEDAESLPSIGIINDPPRGARKGHGDRKDSQARWGGHIGDFRIILESILRAKWWKTRKESPGYPQKDIELLCR